MTDQRTTSPYGTVISVNTKDSLFLPGSFTRSNGSIASRVYERLTKASRRRWTKGLGSAGKPGSSWYERAYRKGVYDALEALRAEV